MCGGRFSRVGERPRARGYGLAAPAAEKRRDRCKSRSGAPPRIEIEGDAPVHRHAAVLEGEPRVDVQLRDLRVVARELRHALDRVLDGVAVGRRLPADSLEQLHPADLPDHLRRVHVGDLQLDWL